MELHVALSRLGQIEEFLISNDLLNTPISENHEYTGLVLGKLNSDLKKTQYSEYYHNLFT